MNTDVHVEQMIAKFPTVISVVKEQAYSSLLGLSSVGSKAPDCIQWWYVSTTYRLIEVVSMTR